MKLQIVSDLHLEFAPIEITNAGADVLVLSGDICVAAYFTKSEASPYHAVAQRWLAWFEATCAQFERVYYVLGNHEHYKGKFYDSTQILRDALGHISNLYILDNEISVFRDFVIVGTTLWTDFNQDAMGAKLAVQSQLNDYHLIQSHNHRKLRPVDTLLYHRAALVTIEAACQGDNHVLVIGHHAPSLRSIEPKYQGAGDLNYGYASNLEAFIVNHSQIKLWTHGHVHSSHDYEIGCTRILANPRGYANTKLLAENENRRFNPSLVIDV